MRTFRAFLEEIEEIGPYIKVRLPKVRQTKNYTCGAAALRAVCELFGVGPENEKDFMKACKTTKEGTHPQDIVRAARSFGLSVKSQEKMTMDTLKANLDMGRPVICCIQAYGDPDEKSYRKPDNGHYVVACGYDKALIYFEDPLMADSRGFLSYKDFKKRWHDKDNNGKLYKQYGITLWKSGGEIDPKSVPQAKRIP